MLCLQEPAESMAISWLDGQRKTPFSYKETGGTRREQAPRGYRSDCYRASLGNGRDVFELAKTAIKQWKMFPAEITRLYWPHAPIESGSTVAVAFRVGVLWSLNACRIVYTIDQQVDHNGDRVARFGFAYGTLPTHALRGEERFTVEWCQNDDSVWYAQAAFSRPMRWWGYLGYPLLRSKQQLFRQLSAKAMQRAICDATKALG